MAIDDNTVYGLYGSQIKDLAGKIEEKQDELTAGEGISITDESGALVISSTGGSGPTVVQSTGTSTTDVMSQNAVTSMVFADPATQKRVKIGALFSGSDGSVVIGQNAKGGGSSNADVVIGASAYANNGNQNIVIGVQAQTSGNSSHSIAIGASAKVETSVRGAIALGPGAHATVSGTMDIGASLMTDRGYNSTVYRLLTGLYDGQSAHDAATKGQLDSAVSTLETELDAKQDVLTAGQNITIAEESGALVISATGGGADAFTTNEWNALWA